MPFKFKHFLLISLVSMIGTAHAGDRNQDVFQVQVFKNSVPFSNPNSMITVDGEWAKSSRFLRTDQISVDCKTNVMKSVERVHGTFVEARREANSIKTSITIKDVEPQILPSNMDKCVAVTANEQKSKKVDVEFTVTDASKGEFTKDLGDGYSMVFKAARLVN